MRGMPNSSNHTPFACIAFCFLHLLFFPSSHRTYINKTKAMPKRPMPPFDQQAEGGGGASTTAIERLLALCASKGAGQFGIQLVRCIGEECDEVTLERILGRFEAKDEARSMSVLPEELVERVCEYAVAEVGEVGLLALVSKQFRAMVMSSRLMGELTIKTEAKFAIEEVDDDEDYEEAKSRASSLLEVYLRQAAEHYPLIGAVELGSEDEGALSYVGNVHVQIASSFRSLKRLSLTL